jgi:tripartite-type tricarboxylate transporter receptor subunit TctC
MTSIRALAGACAAALASLCAFVAPVHAQNYPTRSITMIVPFAAGGPTDVISRIVTAHMAQTLGQSIIIENVVGAGGTTATARAARAANDGYTLITGHMGTHAASVPLYPKLAYHPEKDFEPIALLAGTPILILARKDFPPKDLKEFVTYVKANVEKMNAAHAGIGSVSHVSCELLHSILDIKPVSVPFNGTGPAMNALVAGQVDYMCDQIVNAVPQINAGAQSVAAERADHGGSRPAGFPGPGLERDVRAEGNFSRGSCEPECRRRQGARRRDRAQAPARARQRHPGGKGPDAGGARRPREERDREVDPGAQAGTVKSAFSRR